MCLQAQVHSHPTRAVQARKQASRLYTIRPKLYGMYFMACECGDREAVSAVPSGACGMPPGWQNLLVERYMMPCYAQTTTR